MSWTCGLGCDRCWGPIEFGKLLTAEHSASTLPPRLCIRLGIITSILPLKLKAYETLKEPSWLPGPAFMRHGIGQLFDLHPPTDTQAIEVSRGTLEPHRAGQRVSSPGSSSGTRHPAAKRRFLSRDGSGIPNIVEIPLGDDRSGLHGAGTGKRNVDPAVD